LSSFGKETALQAYKRGPPSLVCMLRHSLQHVSYDDIVVVGKHAIRIFWWFPVFIVWFSTIELI